MSTWQTVIGLEVHCQLATETKLFCGCSTAFGAEPNTQTCPVCLGHPGVLPVLNAEAVRLAIRAALALGCEIQGRSVFARKHYFYPDLPKAYQITQYEQPYCTGGRVVVDLEGVRAEFALTRIHMEEDAGKSVHTSGTTSEIDLNRAGTPLIEIVSEPVLETADQAVAYLKELRQVVRTLEICDGHLEQGSFRCDANVSVRRPGAPLGTKVELKNLNSFTFIKRAIEYEVARQTDALESGGRVVQETRLWDERDNRTKPMRGKEDAHDYRYFPDPDLPPLTLPAGFVEGERSSLPELPTVRRARYRDALGLSAYDAEVLTTSEPAMVIFFEEVLLGDIDPKLAANWVLSELRGRLNADNIGYDVSPVSPGALWLLLGRLQSGRISGKLAKDAFARIYAGESAEAALAAVGETVTDTAALDREIAQVLDLAPGEVLAYHGGKSKVLGFFVGQVMKRTGGKASPPLCQELVLKALEARRP